MKVYSPHQPWDFEYFACSERIQVYINYEGPFDISKILKILIFYYFLLCSHNLLWGIK